MQNRIVMHDLRETINYFFRHINKKQNKILSKKSANIFVPPSGVFQIDN